MLSVSVGALVFPLAPSSEFPVIAHFGLLFTLILLDVLFTLRLTFELLVTFFRTGAIVGTV